MHVLAARTLREGPTSAKQRVTRAIVDLTLDRQRAMGPPSVSARNTILADGRVFGASPPRAGLGSSRIRVRAGTRFRSALTDRGPILTHLKPSLAALAATSAFLLAAPAAQAWYVDISITGAGRVYETTDADELDEHCPDAIEGFASPGTTPTGTLGASCRAGDAGGDYGYGWVVRYVAEAAAGYRFAGWQSDGRTNPGPVLCDGSGGSSSYAGAVCQFATFQNLQTRARFVDDTDPSMSSLTGPNQVVNGPATFTFSAAARSDLPILRVPGRRGPRVANVQLGATGEPRIRDVHVPGPRRGLER